MVLTCTLEMMNSQQKPYTTYTRAHKSQQKQNKEDKQMSFGEI